MHCINTRHWSISIIFFPSKRTTFRVCATFRAFSFAHDPREIGVQAQHFVLHLSLSLESRCQNLLSFFSTFWCSDAVLLLRSCALHQSLSTFSLDIAFALAQYAAMCLGGIGHAACHVTFLHKQHPFVHFNCTEHPVHNNNNKYMEKMLKLLIHRLRTQTECSIRIHNKLLKWNQRSKSSRSRSLLITV